VKAVEVLEEDEEGEGVAAEVVGVAVEEVEKQKIKK